MRNALVKDEETFQHLEFMLIRHGAPDLVVQFFVSERLGNLQTLV